jgi:hypothetical protein
MANKVLILESTSKETLQEQINDHCQVLDVFATQTHINSINNMLIYSAVLFYKVK